MPLVRKPAIEQAGIPLDEAAVRQALRSPQADQRWSAARAVMSVTGLDDALVAALDVEEDARVREAMLTSLAHRGTPAALAPLMSMVRSETAALRTAALDALRLTPGLAQVIDALLQDPEPDVRLLSCDLARALPASLSNRLLAGLLLHEAHANVCAAAVDVLAEVGDASALGGLASCAARFPANEFLQFAIGTVVDRIKVATASARV